jgi:hypothetical protein
VLTRSWEKPIVNSPDISEFRAHEAAVSKARELGPKAEPMAYRMIRDYGGV